MKNLHLLAGTTAALAMFGCGGGGGGTTSVPPNGGGTPAPVGTHIEAVVLHPTTYDDGSQSKGQTFELQDLNTIQSLDQIQFELVYYDGTGARVVLNASAWSDNDSSGSYGQLSYNNGVFIASHAQTASPLTVNVIYNGVTYSAFFNVLPREVRERGILLSDTTHKPVAGVELDFYGYQNPEDTTTPIVFRGKTVTQNDGTFRASVPAQTIGFTLVNSTIPTSFKRIFRYRGALYNTQDSSPLGLALIPTQNPPVTPVNPADFLISGEYFLTNYGIANDALNGTVLLIPTTENVTPPPN